MENIEDKFCSELPVSISRQHSVLAVVIVVVVVDDDAADDDDDDDDDFVVCQTVCLVY